MKLLLIKNDGLGDMVIATPIINNLSKAFEGNIDILCDQRSERYVEKCIKHQKLFVSRKDVYFKFPNLCDLSFKNKLKELIKIIFNFPLWRDYFLKKELQKKKYDYIIVLRRFIRQSTFYFMENLSSPNKIAMWQYPTNLTIITANKLTLNWQHITGSHKLIHEYLYFNDVLSKSLSFYKPVKLKIPKLLFRNSKRAALVLGNVNKGLNKNQVNIIIDYLIQNQYTVDIFGGVDTKKKFIYLEKSYKKINFYAGRISLFDGYSLVKEKADFVIGNDTGFMHLLSDIGLKQLIFLSGETPLRFFPWVGFNHQYLASKSCKFSDCVYCKLPKRECVHFKKDEIILILNNFLSKNIPNIVIKTVYNKAWRWLKK